MTMIKTELYKWLGETFNDLYAVVGGDGTTTRFNMIDHADSTNHDGFWTALQAVDKTVFNEDNLKYKITESYFYVEGDGTTKYSIVPFDNEIYHTYLMEGNNGQH